MRVIVVTTWFPTARAPASGPFVVADALAMAGAGNDVEVVHLVPAHQDDGTRRVRHHGLRVLRIPMTPTRPGQVVAAARALRAALAGADVVHTAAISALLPFALGRPRGPWVHTEHFSGMTYPRSLAAPVRAAFPAVRRLLARPDAVTAACEFLARPVRAVRGDRPTLIVPCVVPPFDAVPERPRRTSDRPLRLVFVGGLIDRKDPLLAVDTLAELTARGVRAELTLVGDGPLAGTVRARATEHGVSDRVRLAGTLDRAGVVAELSAADLFFCPTRGDNFFVACAEAIVAGRPVVVGATGGQGEYVDPRVGALVDEQSAEAYAAAICDVDERTRDLTAQEIAATIGDRFSPAKVAAGYDEVHARARAIVAGGGARR